MDFTQYGIILLGPLAIFLTSCKDHKLSRWGYIIGFLSQPFWFYTAIINEQVGIFIVAIFYTASWIKGIWTFWILPLIKDLSEDWINDQNDSSK